MRLELHLYLHDDLSGSADRKLDLLLAQGRELLIMNAETTAALGRIETATTDLGVRVRAIQDKVGTGMSAADVAAVNDELGAIAGNLEGMAKDPENPIPSV